VSVTEDTVFRSEGPRDRGAILIENFDDPVIDLAIPLDQAQ
jgi:hypothetical protein